MSSFTRKERSMGIIVVAQTAQQLRDTPTEDLPKLRELFDQVAHNPATLLWQRAMAAVCVEAIDAMPDVDPLATIYLRSGVISPS